LESSKDICLCSLYLLKHIKYKLVPIFKTLPKLLHIYCKLFSWCRRNGNKLSFVNNVIISVENPSESTGKLWNILNDLPKFLYTKKSKKKEKLRT
jgi:hypothetical protein